MRPLSLAIVGADYPNKGDAPERKTGATSDKVAPVEGAARKGLRAARCLRQAAEIDLLANALYGSARSHG